MNLNKDFKKSNIEDDDDFELANKFEDIEPIKIVNINKNNNQKLKDQKQNKTVIICDQQ